MGRSPCCVKEGLNRGAWTSQEDKILKDYIKVHGEGKWRSLPKRAGLKRCGKSCRLRWLNYLRPDIKRGNITNDEEDLIIRLHKLLGNRWSLIAGRLPGRTDNEIKNYWNTNISKRVHNDQVQDRENNHNLVRCRGRNRDHHHSNSATHHHHHHGNPPPTTSYHESAKKNLSSSSINNKSEKVYNNINNNGPLSPPIREGSYVVRTKASRCTKVFINAEVDQIPDTTTTINNNMEIMKAPSIINSITTTTAAADHIDATTQPLLVPTFLREDDININISSADHQLGLMEEDDDKFLSEFLSSTTTPFDDFVDLGFADINLLLPILTPDNIPSSQNADQTTSISAQEEQEEEVNDQQNYSNELGSMASLLDPALDWLHDE